MKLLSKEPTPEMLSIISNEKEVFHSAESLYAALYAAAPEVKQEPVAFEYHGRFSFAHIHQDERFLYTFPPDAQAEIKKQSARIKELEMAIDNELVVSHLGVFNSGDNPKAALNKLQCCAEDIGAFFAQERLKEQAERIKKLEKDLTDYRGDAKVDTLRLFRNQQAISAQTTKITQLKAVIAKCHSALTQCKQWKEGVNTLTCHNHGAVEEALAAIKEINDAATE